MVAVSRKIGCSIPRNGVKTAEKKLALNGDLRKSKKTNHTRNLKNSLRKSSALSWRNKSHRNSRKPAQFNQKHTEIMTTDQQLIEPEIIQADDKLIKFANATGLEKPAALSLAETFKPIFAKARAAIADAQGVAESVKDSTCVREIRKSRACRLALRAVRLESENTRRAQKQHALLYGKAVDGFHNILLADLSPVETALQEAEDVAERAEAARLAQLKADREKELVPLLDDMFHPGIVGDLSALSEKDFAKMLSDAKLLRQAKIDAAAKIEADRKAKEESDRIERERIAAENVRLKVEAEAREAAAKAEREEAARKLAAEREAAEKKLAEERAAAAAAAKKAAEQARKEREAIEAAAKAAAEKARKEREEVEAKARAERAAADAAARKEQARLQAVAVEEHRKAAAAEAQARAAREAEAKKAAEAAAAAKRAAAAPDNSKAKAFADLLREMPLPQFAGQAWALLPSKVEALAKWIEAQISNGVAE